VRLVVFLPLRGIGQVRNRTAFHDAEPGRHRADRAKREYRRRRDRAIWSGANGQSGPRDVGFEIVVGFVQRLPDAVQIGLAVGQARRSICGRPLTCNRTRDARQPCTEDGGRDSDRNEADGTVHI